MKKNIRIATRNSKLALWQANFIKSKLEKKYPALTISLFEVTTEGDQQLGALTDVGGKSVFVKALQNALLNDEADIAVHSIKDMSVSETDGLTLAAICERGDARDAFVSNDYANVDALPHNAIVGTASPRRISLIKSMRPDLQIKLLRGNVDTRLSKLAAKNYDAIILAAAGLQRLNLSFHIRSYFSDIIFTPAIAQGAIGVEARVDDHVVLDLLRFLNHANTVYCVMAERTVNQIIGGDCYTAIGAYATLVNRKIVLSAMVGSLDGKIILRAKTHSELELFRSGSKNIHTFCKAKQLAEAVANDLLKQGASRLIHHA